jgi:hypothetical protein
MIGSVAKAGTRLKEALEMDGEQIREFHMSRFAIVLATIALFVAVLTPTAGATSPSQDQYGSALPGVGGGNGGGSPSTSSPSGTGKSTIPVAPSDQKGGAKAGSNPSGGNGGRSSHAGSKAGSSHKGKGSEGKGSGSTNGQPVNTNNAGQSVPHIAADSAGDTWVPWFIGGLLALGAAGGVLLYRNRRRAAQS